jgi:hypothetical protein
MAAVQCGDGVPGDVILEFNFGLNPESDDESMQFESASLTTN